MFPSAKKRPYSAKSHGPTKKRKMSPGKPTREDKGAKSPNRSGLGGAQRDGRGKGWKKFKDGEKPFGKKMQLGGKTFKGKPFPPKTSSEGKMKFSKKKNEGHKTFGGKKDKSRNQRVKPGFKKKGPGAQQGFKKKKGKG